MLIMSASPWMLLACHSQSGGSRPLTAQSNVIRVSDSMGIELPTDYKGSLTEGGD